MHSPMEYDTIIPKKGRPVSREFPSFGFLVSGFWFLVSGF